MPRARTIKLIALAALFGALGLALATNESDESRASGGYYGPQSGGVAAPEGITVTGVGQVRIKRPARLSDATIGEAVSSALRSAFPKALENARTHAEAVAQSLGMKIGDVEAVAETGDAYSTGAYGRFGIGRFCGVVPRRVFGRDAAGHRVVLRVKRNHRCIVPRQSAVTLAVRYEKD